MINLDNLQISIYAMFSRKFPDNFGILTVDERPSMRSSHLEVRVSPSLERMNNHAMVALWIDEDEFRIQNYGGNGGQCLWLKGYERVKIRFTKPRQHTPEKILQSLDKFLDNYIAALKEHNENLQDYAQFTDVAKEWLKGEK